MNNESAERISGGENSFRLLLITSFYRSHFALGASESLLSAAALARCQQPLIVIVIA